MGNEVTKVSAARKVPMVSSSLSRVPPASQVSEARKVRRVRSVSEATQALQATKASPASTVSRVRSVKLVLKDNQARRVPEVSLALLVSKVRTVLPVSKVLQVLLDNLLLDMASCSLDTLKLVPPQLALWELLPSGLVTPSCTCKVTSDLTTKISALLVLVSRASAPCHT